jgi:hypothetical protein
MGPEIAVFLVPIMFIAAAATITITAMTQHHRRRMEEIRAHRVGSTEVEALKQSIDDLRDRLNVAVMAMEGRGRASADSSRDIVERLERTPPPVPVEARSAVQPQSRL